MKESKFLDTQDDLSDDIEDNEDDDAMLAGNVVDLEATLTPGTLKSKMSARARIEQLAEEKALRNTTQDIF